jgi:hypothetical protein
VAITFHEAGDVGITADFAIFVRQRVKIQAGKGVAVGGLGRDAVIIQRPFAGEMGRLVEGRADTDVDVRLPPPDGQELGMGIGHVQERDIAVIGDLVRISGCSPCCLYGPRPEKPGSSSHPHQL